jgi:hypothetical protein
LRCFGGGKRMKDPRLLSTEELRELMELAQTLLAEREDQKRRFEQQSKRRASKGVWIRLERVRCGQKRCRKCSGEGLGHGPYWYAYFHKDGKLKSRYLGKTLPEEYRQLLPEEEI